ncbi:MAG: NAD(P)H-hydrate dehydratase [Parvularculales bacterium]
MTAVLTCEQMSKADRLAVEQGVSGLTLMENAGQAVAQSLMETFDKSVPVKVLCGPGNNGGDGFVAARHLREGGWMVDVYLSGSPENLAGDAAEMARRWMNEGGGDETSSIKSLRDLTGEGAGPDNVIVDALFGAGLVRDITGEAADAINIVRECGAPVIAVDMPSGIDGDGGFVRGYALRAVRTVTFFRPKPAHFLMPGRHYCGQITVADIGIPPSVLESINPSLHYNEAKLWSKVMPHAAVGGHKYERGHVVVISGGPLSTGAARLAARGALRTGAGVVTVAGAPDAALVNASHLTSIMVEAFDDTSVLERLLQDRRKNVIVIGPGNGAGEETRTRVACVLASQAAVVLDADGLTSWAEEAPRLFALIAEREGAVVLTPHEGEFARLFPDINHVSKTARACEAARRSGAVVILKGADSVIATPQGTCALNDNGPPFLATAGSGDVLAGMVGGLLAQAMPAFEAAAMAVWMHGAAADSFGGPGLIAEDLPDRIPSVYEWLDHR